MTRTLQAEDLNNLCKNTMIEHLGIEFTEVSKGRVVARMPIDERTIQPMRRLHGGAIMTLAESVGSAGSLMLVDPSEYYVLGVEISGSHVGSTSEHFVWAEAQIVHQGTTSHVWEIHVKDKNDTLISVCLLTNRIFPINNKA
ncbi:MAG: PaaI family thioesterase [Bacteroidota bacterium]|nr:PaaI family thioesterase [Bacteroidota bacterium]